MLNSFACACVKRWRRNSRCWHSGMPSRTGRWRYTLFVSRDYASGKQASWRGAEHMYSFDPADRLGKPARLAVPAKESPHAR